MTQMIWDLIGETLTQVVGNPLILGVIFIFYIVMMALSMRLNSPALLVIMIPTMVVASLWVGVAGKIFMGVALGVIIALALIRWVRK